MDKYTFPLWSLEDRVIGQPTKHLDLKYSSTYLNVANHLINSSICDLPQISMMGLFATNYDTLIDYLRFQLNLNNKNLPNIETCLIVERDKSVANKIIEKLSLKNKKHNYLVLNSQLKTLTKDKFIELQNLNKFNFIDLDFMHNWGNEKQFLYVPSLINMYATDLAVVHINAISYYPRTLQLTRSRSQIEKLLQVNILDNINFDIKEINFSSYRTCSRAPTEMTSVTLTIQKRI